MTPIILNSILVYQLTEIRTMVHLNSFILSKIANGLCGRVSVIYMTSLFSLISSIMLAVANIHIYCTDIYTNLILANRILEQFQEYERHDERFNWTTENSLKDKTILGSRASSNLTVCQNFTPIIRLPWPLGVDIIN